MQAIEIEHHRQIAVAIPGVADADLVDGDLLRSAEHFVGRSGFAPADHRRALLHERHAGRCKL